jgi:hypothetical protein
VALSRGIPIRRGTSSQVRSIQSYYPFYPPPVIDEDATDHTGYAGFAQVPGSYVDERTDKGIVDRHNQRWGEFSRYTHGNVMRHGVFHMRGTGQVESTIFQMFTNMPSIAQFNNWLYRAAKGYPQNLGLSEKVPTLPKEALGDTPNGAMQPRQQITRNIFTKRSGGTVKNVPAQPQSR